MAKIKPTIFANRQKHETPQVKENLEKVAEEFIGEHGGRSLGDLDTPTFMRRVCNVALLSQNWNRDPRPPAGETPMRPGSRALSY